MDDKVTIVIADDHPLFRRGLIEVVQTESNLEIVGEADDGAQALTLIRALKPTIAILDIAMPRVDGFAVAGSVREEKLPVSIIFLTMYRERKLFERALEMKVSGYVLKDSAANDIVSGINAVAMGRHFVSPELTSYLIDASRVSSSGSSFSQHGNMELSPAERRVLDLIGDYKTSKEIADELCISPRTVETHRAHICQKAGLRGTHALMKFALNHKSLYSQDPTRQDT